MAKRRVRYKDVGKGGAGVSVAFLVDRGRY